MNTNMLTYPCSREKTTIFGETRISRTLGTRNFKLIGFKYCLFFASFLWLSQPTIAAEHGSTPPQGDEAKGLTPKASAESLTTTGYANDWIKMPAIEGQIVGSTESKAFTPTQGKILVVVFLASWCEPCQDLMEDLKRMHTKYDELFTDFVFVFSHDTNADAQSFMKEYKVKSPGIMANTNILKNFHNPSLPSVYLADRHGWLAYRLLEAKKEDMAKLENFLKLTTAY